ncbi:hypothetical protein A2U01_0105262, partial [Trifolium medium]|nr:hypothetical protein [Trifolium medium]
MTGSVSVSGALRRSTGALRRLIQKIAGWALLVARCAGRYGALRKFMWRVMHI